MSANTTIDRPDTATTQEIDTDLDAAFRDIVGSDEKVDDADAGGDHERLSHYVSKDDIVKSSTTGVPVRAVCGKKWTPSRNPEKFPVCPECKDIYGLMKDQ